MKKGIGGRRGGQKGNGMDLWSTIFASNENLKLISWIQERPVFMGFAKIFDEVL